jgi:tetratricopeptide (TPR) repeat protein
LTHRANVHASNKVSFQPLHMAVEYGGGVDLCALLVEYGAEVNAAAERCNGVTPLGLCLPRPPSDPVRVYLVGLGAQADSVNASDVAYRLISNLIEYDDLDEAEAMIRECLRGSPDDPAFLGLYALLLEKQDKFVDARYVYERAYKSGPPSATRLVNHAMLVESQFKDYKDAEKLYLEALVLAPDDVRALYSLGDLYETLNQPEKAKAMYRKVLTVESAHLEVQNNLCAILREEVKRGSVAAADEAIAILGNTPQKWLTSHDPMQLQMRMLMDDLLYRREELLLSEVASRSTFAANTCEICHRSATSRCSRCQARHYCSRECQRSHWATHRHSCVQSRK